MAFYRVSNGGMRGEITLTGTIYNSGWMSDGAGDSTSNHRNVTIKFQINNDGSCTLIEGSMSNSSSSSVGHVTPSQVTLNSSATFTISSMTVAV